jgi:integrase
VPDAVGRIRKRKLKLMIDLTTQAIVALKNQLKSQELQSPFIYHNPHSHELWASEHLTFRYSWKETLDDVAFKYRYPYQMCHTFVSHRICLAAWSQRPTQSV